MSFKLVIELEFKGSPVDAKDVADSLLDGGAIQDLFEDHEFDSGKVRIVNAKARVERGGE